MDLKTALVLAKRFLTSTVVVILMFASGMAWIWGKYETLVGQRNQLAAERQAFNNERLAAEIVLSERKAELDKREFIVQQQGKDYQEQLANLQKGVAEYSVVSAKLKQEQAEVSKAQRTKDAEEKMERLMSEFSALGVDLNDRMNCDNPERWAKYNAAKAKYSEIAALSKAYGLKGRYDSFLLVNGQRMYHQCPWLMPSWAKSHSADEVKR
jgi:hypothetical protein